MIELLIVVAIIGILAAIAVPNFLNAQIRTKISRVSADFNMLRTTLEMYYIDNNGYPIWTVDGLGVQGFSPNTRRYTRLTTPIAYMSSIPVDPFAVFINQEHLDIWGNAYDSVTDEMTGQGRTWGHRWQVNSWGPDTFNSWLNRYPADFYHGSNGLLSHGDLGIFGPKSAVPLNEYHPPLPYQ